MAETNRMTDYDRAQSLKGLKLYDLSDVQKILGVGKRTLQNYAAEGRLKAVKIGGRWRVTEEALRAFLKLDKPE